MTEHEVTRKEVKAEPLGTPFTMWQAVCTCGWESPKLTWVMSAKISGERHLEKVAS